MATEISAKETGFTGWVDVLPAVIAKEEFLSVLFCCGSYLTIGIVIFFSGFSILLPIHLVLLTFKPMLAMNSQGKGKFDGLICTFA